MRSGEGDDEEDGAKGKEEGKKDDGENAGGEGAGGCGADIHPGSVLACWAALLSSDSLAP